jgi:hypothetical protein
LLTDDQKAAYDKIYADYHAQRAQLDQERSALMHGADEESRALLDDSQKATWDELTKEFLAHHGPHGPGGPGGPPGPGGPGATAAPPTTQP